MATTASTSKSRAIWKGAIAFGLVHIPVSLHSATQQEQVDFDWLDKRTMDPVGYKRINKRTGKEIASEHIVKGVKLDGGEYVVLSDEEIQAVFPKRTHTIAIESFVPADEVSSVYAERPYYLVPEEPAKHVYTLLREALEKAQVVGIARFVLHNKQHLAALSPAGPALMLGTLRWANEIRPPDALDLPEPKAASNLKPAELKMAQQLIGEMTTAFDPTEFADDFTEAIKALVARKANSGGKASVEPVEASVDFGSSNVVDLTELLRQSLARKPGAGPAPPAAKTKAAPTKVKNTAASPSVKVRKTAPKKLPAKKAA